MLGNFNSVHEIYNNPPALAGNVFTNPYALENASWNAASNLTRNANTYLAPDGSKDADSLIPNTNTGVHTLSQTTLTTTGGDWIARCRFRSAGFTWVDMLVANNNSYNKYAAVTVNLHTAVAIVRDRITYAVTNMKAKRLSNGWVLFEYIIPGVDANSTHRVDFNITNDVAAFSFTGTNDIGVYGWGLEFAPVPN